jgi:outer membrane immunogenic protein
MNAFRVSAAALLVASFSAGAVQASDLPHRTHMPMAPMMAPIYNWTGFYLGGNLGGGFGNVRTKHYFPRFVTKYNSPATGFLGGLQAGYNYQWTDWFVIGAEADITWANVTSSRGYNIIGAGHHFKLNYMGTVRARAGYAADRALMYITGGYAYGGMKNNYLFFTGFFPGNVTVAAASKTKTQNGWTLGGGMEYALTQNLLVRTEYLYMGFQKSKYNPFSPVVLSGLTTRAQVSVVRAGLSWKF